MTKYAVITLPFATFKSFSALILHVLLVKDFHIVIIFLYKKGEFINMTQVWDKNLTHDLLKTGRCSIH